MCVCENASIALGWATGLGCKVDLPCLDGVHGLRRLSPGYGPDKDALLIELQFFCAVIRREASPVRS